MFTPRFSFRKVAAMFATSGISLLAVATLVFYARAATASLNVSPSSTFTPPSAYVAGTTGVTVGKFVFTAGNASDVKINSVAADFLLYKGGPTSSIGLVQNVRLLDGDVQLGPAAAALTTADAAPQTNWDTGYVRFTNLGLTLPKGTSKVLTVVADLNSSALYSNTRISVQIVNAYDKAASAGVVAVSATTGAKIIVSGTYGTTAATKSVPVYKTMLTVAQSASAMAPGSIGMKAFEEPVAQFVIVNSANDSGTAAKISSISLAVSTDIKPSKGALLTLYRGDTISGAGLLGTATFVTGTSTPVFKLASPMYIDSGASQTITVIANTIGSVGSGGVVKLNVGIPAGGIVWTDGLASQITTVFGLPLTGKTIVFM